MSRDAITETLLQQSGRRASDAWPRLEAYAPTVRQESLQHRPDVAGRFDPDSRSVILNSARETPLNEDQATGLVGLERARGHLASPVGQAWTDAMPLPNDQRNFWDGFYLPPGVESPSDQESRDRIIKATMLSRMLVGDQAPLEAPPFTKDQKAVAQLYSSYARGRR